MLLLHILIIITSTNAEHRDAIDQLHLKMYPYCGCMYYRETSTAASGRAVNANNNTDLYRWLVYLQRENMRHGLPGSPDEINHIPCTGSVITDR